MLCTNGWQHSHWCKYEVAAAFHGHNCHGKGWFNYDGEGGNYYSIKQVQASLILFKVNKKTIDFVREWYSWCIMPGMIDDTSRGPQFPEFQQHRYDQAILTAISIKYGIKQRWFPSTTNLHQHTAENYGVVVLHHRMRNENY